MVSVKLFLVQVTIRHRNIFHKPDHIPRHCGEPYCAMILVAWSKALTGTSDMLQSHHQKAVHGLWLAFYEWVLRRNLFFKFHVEQDRPTSWLAHRKIELRLSAWLLRHELVLMFDCADWYKRFPEIFFVRFFSDINAHMLGKQPNPRDLLQSTPHDVMSKQSRGQIPSLKRGLGSVESHHPL